MKFIIFSNIDGTSHFQLRHDLIKGLSSTIVSKEVEGKKVTEDKRYVIAEGFSIEISELTYNSIVEQLNKK